MMEEMDAAEVKRTAKGMMKSRLEWLFISAWRRDYSQLPEPVREYRFHSKRKWRLDFAFVPEKLAVEIQGGAWIKGAHNTAIGQQRDLEKQREAVKLGWRILPFNTLDLKDPDWVARQVAEVLTNAKATA